MRWLAVVSVAALGCSSQSTSASDAGSPDTANATSDAAVADVAPPPPESDGGVFGVVPIVDETDTPCSAPTAGTTPLDTTAASGLAPALNRLAKIGARRVAWSDEEGFVLFDANGGNVTTPAIALGDGGISSSFGVEAPTLGGAGEDGVNIFYQRYDSQGALVGAPIVLSPAPGGDDGLTIGTGGGASLVVWGSGGTLHARGITTAGALAGVSFDFGVGSYDAIFHASAVSTGADDFAVVWTGKLADGSYRTYFVKATLTAVSGTPSEITTTALPTIVNKVVRTPSGYAVLMDGLAIGGGAVLVNLDATGKVAGAAHRFLGTLRGWDIATQGSEIGLMAKRAINPPHPIAQVEFRPLDASGRAIAPWVCFDGPTSDYRAIAGIDTEGAGYAIVYRTPAGNEVFTRVDRLGTGAP